MKNINLQAFRELSKTKQKQHVGELLGNIRDTRSIPYYLDGEEKKIMLDVVSRHEGMRSDYNHKKNENIHEVFVKQNIQSHRFNINRFKNPKYLYSFHLLYTDGFIDDVSYHACFSPKQKNMHEYANETKMNISNHAKSCIKANGLQPIPENCQSVAHILTQRSEEDENRPFVYFIWENGKMVYIGVTNHLYKRMMFHDQIKQKDFHKTYISTLEYWNREDAGKQEIEYIKTVDENNLYNLRNKRLYKPSSLH